MTAPPKPPVERKPTPLDYGMLDSPKDFADIRDTRYVGLAVIGPGEEFRVPAGELPVRVAPAKGKWNFIGAGTGYRLVYLPATGETEARLLTYRHYYLGYEEYLDHPPALAFTADLEGGDVVIKAGGRGLKVSKIAPLPGKEYAGIPSDLKYQRPPIKEEHVVEKPASMIVDSLSRTVLPPQVRGGRGSGGYLSYQEMTNDWMGFWLLTQVNVFRFQSNGSYPQEHLWEVIEFDFRRNATTVVTNRGNQRRRAYRGPFPVIDAYMDVPTEGVSRFPKFTIITTDEFAEWARELDKDPDYHMVHPHHRFVGETDALADPNIRRRLTIEGLRESGNRMV